MNMGHSLEFFLEELKLKCVAQLRRRGKADPGPNEIYEEDQRNVPKGDSKCGKTMSLPPHTWWLRNPALISKSLETE